MFRLLEPWPALSQTHHHPWAGHESSSISAEHLHAVTGFFSGAIRVLADKPARLLPLARRMQRLAQVVLSQCQGTAVCGWLADREANLPWATAFVSCSRCRLRSPISPFKNAFELRTQLDGPICRTRQSSLLLRGRRTHQPPRAHARIDRARPLGVGD